jgi:hypothetical protein
MCKLASRHVVASSAHGGTKPDSGVFKAIATKTPPQGPDDSKMLP